MTDATTAGPTDRPPQANWFSRDLNLQSILARRWPDGIDRWREPLADFAAWAAAEVDPQAEFSDRTAPPELEAYDRAGRRIDRVRYNPAWRAVSREVYRRGIVGLNYGALESGSEAAPFLVTFAMGYLLAQADISLHCPVTMTGAVAHVLDRYAPAAVRDAYLPDLVRTDGEALTGGTWATELHGGSDVGATTTTARPAGDHVLLDGLKWFVSNAGGGLALATARPEGAAEGGAGLGLYLVPATRPDGGPNPMRIRRLKDKLGTRGIATGEVELDGTWAVEVAPPPDGLKLMMEALEFSRLQNVMGALGVQRRVFVEALDYAAARVAFGRPITAFPMLQDELLRILVPLEAGCALGFEAAAAFDAALADAAARPWLRLVTALAKFRTAEDANTACRVAMEVVGGNAYTYDYPFARLLRDAQVLSIWEGPANIQALELLRLLGNRAPGHEAFEARLAGILDAAPADLDGPAQALAAARADFRAALSHIRGDGAKAQRHARRLMGLMADILAAALLVEEAAEGLARGDARKALVARLFVEDRLAPPARRGIGPGRDWVSRHFDALVGGVPVAADHLAKS